MSEGFVHPSVIYRGSHYKPHPGSAVRIGTDSIFCGRLIFARIGAFTMGERSYVGPNTSVHIASEITIGNDVMISWGCTLIDTDMHSPHFSERKNDVLIAGSRLGLRYEDKDWSVVASARINIADKVWVGFNSIILKGTSLGEGCVIGAGSVVTSDVPPWTLVAGNPARPMRALDPEIDATESILQGRGDKGIQDSQW